MKKFSKIIASTIVAASMISLATVSASAADYGVRPIYPTPSNPTVKPEDTTTKEEDTSKDVDSSVDSEKVVVEVGSVEKPVETVTEETVANAIAAVIADEEADEVVIYVAKEEAAISEAAIGEIAKNDVVVTLSAENCTVTIDPALITEVKDIDLAMDISIVADEAISEIVSKDVTVPAKALVIAPAQKGDFGMTVTVTIPAATVEEFDSDNLFCYYISDDGEIEDLTDDLVLNDDGSISLAISHASQYVVTDEEMIADEEAEIDDDAEEEDDESDGKDAEDVIDAGETEEDDSNPGTGVALFGTAALAAISAAAVTVTAKKRK